MKGYRGLTAVAVTLLVVSLGFSYASAAGWPPPKPKLITIATFDIGASTYAELAAIGEGIHKKFGVKIRNVPVGNSIARAIATRAGSTQIWGSCSAYYACAEGIFDFATPEWGPQPIRALTMSKRTASFSPGTGKKSGIKTMADVKGKRVGWIVGNPTINMQLRAYLAFGGLTTDDVELVKFPGYSASLRGLMEGKADVVMAGNRSTGSFQIAASPTGLTWIPIPSNDVEGWKRLREKAPFVAPITIKAGAGVTSPVEVGSYPCPVVVAWAQQDEGVVYWLTKMTVESWELYKGAFADGPAWHIKEYLSARRSVPYHRGAVKYFKEKNLWTAELEKRDQYLLKRHKILGKAFEAVKEESMEKKIKAKKFPDFWQKRRAEELKAAGFPVF